MDGIHATVDTRDYREALKAIPDKLRKRALLKALRAAAKPVRTEIRGNTPTLSLASSLKAPYRKAGVLRGAIAVRASKQARRRGDVGVFLNVKPLPKAQRSAKNPLDPFYWRFVNFDHQSRSGKTVKGVHFLETGARRLNEALSEFEAALEPAIAKLNNKGETP
jgi:hypothetical protein